MKKVLYPLLFLVAAAGTAAALIFAYCAMRSERDQEASAEAPVIPPSAVARDQDGGPMLKLTPEAQERLGIRTAVPAAGTVARQLTATACVLDATPLLSQLNEIRAAQAALEAARPDYERKKKLFENGQHTTAAAVEAAAAQIKQAQLAGEAARDRLAAAWGPDLAGRADLAALARAFVAREAALIRCELQPMDKLASPPAVVRLDRQNGQPLTAAQLLGAALRTDSALGGQAWLALAATNAAALVPGTALLAQCDAGEPDTGILLPRDAIVRHGGLGWVYVMTGTNAFSRRPVPLSRPHPDGWLAGGEWPQPIVISGAQSLLSEELKSSIQMRD